MNLTMRRKSALVQAAERGLAPKPSRADYIVAAVVVVGAVIVVLAAMGVV